MSSVPAETTNHSTVSADRRQPRLLLKTHEACEILGGIHARTLARLEQRGLIRGVKLLRHKLYARQDVEALVENLRNWEVSNG
jgi:hypothetical protein